VKKRLACWIFGLSRSSTRQRYRGEFEDLLDDLIASGDAGSHLWLEVALAAARDRLYGLRRTGRVVFAGTVLLSTALGLATWALASSPSPSTITAALASVHSLPHPIDVPTGPQESAASCPNPPLLSARLPSGASISPPSLVPAGTASLIVAGQTYDMSATCEYTLTFAPG